jgi:hypothetical protein
LQAKFAGKPEARFQNIQTVPVFESARGLAHSTTLRDIPDFWISDFGFRASGFLINPRI